MEFEAVGSQAMAAIWMMVIFGLVLSIVPAIIWVVKKKEKATSVLFGVAGFLGFAVFLESIVLNMIVSISTVSNHAWAKILIGALFVGIFEETGRFVIIKVMLEKRKNKETAISYGLGHAGIEVLMLLFLVGVSNLLTAIRINQGLYEDIIEQTRLTRPDSVEALIQAAKQLPSFGITDAIMPIMERISAVLFHIACSIIVFRAVWEKGRIWLYPVAILLHTAFDCIGGLKIITSTFLKEIIIFAAAAAVFAYAIMMYRKMPARYDVEEDEAADKELEDMKKMGL